jgi:hypothetical protein
LTWGPQFAENTLLEGFPYGKLGELPSFAAFKGSPAQNRYRPGKPLMSRPRRLLLTFASCILAWSFAATSHAQGLLWSLPEDGAIVEYAGRYQNKQERPGNAGPLELQWDSRLTIQSVGEEMAEFEGVSTACRWIEFKVVTGKASKKGVEADAGIDPGPHGTSIYKVLIPTTRVKGQLKDDQGLPVTFIPIIKGYRKVGQQKPQVMREKVLSFYPMLGLFANYIDLAPEGDATELDLPNVGAVKAQMYKGTLKLQNDTSKSENVGEIWLSEEIPFGWAKYHVKLTRLEKDITAAEKDFAPAAEIEVEMTAVKKETSGAKSELGDVTDATAAPAAPVEEKPAEEKATEEKPAVEKPAEEKAEEEKPAEKTEM